MDSASPIAERTAGAIAVDVGTRFTFATRTCTAEKAPVTLFDIGMQGVHREDHHRSYGEGQRT